MINIIKGSASENARAQIRFVNDLDMTRNKRFYIIKNSRLDLIRGWRGHRNGHRWFYVLSGSFTIYLVQADNWELASNNLPVTSRIIKDVDQPVLHLPEGYGTAIESLERDSELLVFTNTEFSNAYDDNYSWPLDYFLNLPSGIPPRD